MLQESEGDNAGNVLLSAKQFEQLLKLLPVQQEDKEYDSPFSGMVVCNTVTTFDIGEKEWIIDSGVTDHTTSNILHILL